MVTELLNLDSEIISYELRESEVKKMLTFFNKKLNGLPKKQMELARLNRDVEVLNQNSRIEEIAKMLSGNKVTKSAIEHAKQLMN